MCQVKLVKADYPLTSCCQKVLSIFQMTHRHRYLRHPNEYTFCNQFDMIYEFVDGFNIEMEYSFKLCFYIRIKICVNAPNITQNWKLNGNNATRGEKKIWYTSQIIQRNQIYLIENGIFWWKKTPIAPISIKTDYTEVFDLILCLNVCFSFAFANENPISSIAIPNWNWLQQLHGVWKIFDAILNKFLVQLWTMQL